MPDDNKERHFRVKYKDGSEVHVKAASLTQTDDILALQQDVLEEFLYGGAMLGSILRPSNQRIWNSLRKLSSLLPLVGGGHLDIDQIDDPDEICRVFFTRTLDRDDETGAISPTSSEETYKPSEIARLHGLNFYGLEGVLYQARLGAKKRYEQEQANLEQAQPATEAPVETPPVETPKPKRTRKSTPPASDLPATA